jgi:predicted RNase H-like nuclease (RuvC/YqgF family)
MKMRKRILLQLTPLLDLLITVLFVQAVLLNEVTEVAEKGKADAEAAKVQKEAEKQETQITLQDARTNTARLQKDNAGLTKERDELKQRLENLDKKVRELDDQKRVQEDETRQTQENLLKIAQVTSDMFNMTEETQDKLTGDMPAEVAEKVRQELELIKNEPPTKALQRLMQLDELQKRCDFWKVHVSYDGMVIFSINDKEKGRFSVSPDYPTQQDEFGQKKLPTEGVVNNLDGFTVGIEEPKSIVLVVLTHSNPDSRVVKLVRQAVDAFVEERNSKANSRSRFHHSDWGHFPDQNSKS